MANRSRKRKGRPKPPFPSMSCRQRSALERKTTKALVELGNAATLVQLARTTSPCRVRGRVDFESERVAFLAPGGASLENGAVGHLHLDHVVVGMNASLHGSCSVAQPVPTGR